MRTVTFSSKKVADLVNKGFVSAWKNREPGFHNCEYGTEGWIYQSSRVCFPTKNICTFFLAPDGTVLHYITGYYDPALFAVEAKKALKVWQACYDAEGKAKPDAEKSFVALHKEWARRHVASVTRVAQEGTGWSATLGSASEYHEYLARVHEDLSKGMRTITEVESRHEIGNPFEETLETQKRVDEARSKTTETASQDQPERLDGSGGRVGPEGSLRPSGSLTAAR